MIQDEERARNREIWKELADACLSYLDRVQRQARGSAFLLEISLRVLATPLLPVSMMVKYGAVSWEK